MIAAVDILGMVMALLALVYLSLFRTRGMRLADFLVILGILVMTVIIDFGNFLEWSGITSFFDSFEDYMHVMVAAFWGFFIVSLTQGYYEQAFQRSEARYRDVVEGANSVILRWSPEGRIIFLNRYGLDFFGYGQHEILGREVMGTIVPQTETTGRDLAVMIEELCLNPERYRLNENENMRKDGTRVWVSWTNRPVLDEEGKLQEILSIGNDITDRKKAELALKESEERFRTVVEDQLELVVRWLPDGTRTFVNQSYCRRFGRRQESLLGRSRYLDIHQDDREKLRRRIGTLSPDCSTSADEHRVILPDGSVTWYRWSDRGIFDDGGQLVEIQSVGWDITIRKEAEEKLLASLAEKEILLREVHHRVKNNLQVVSGLLNLQSHGMEAGAARDVFRDSQNRIISMALIHQELYQSTNLARVDFGAYTRCLARNLLASYGKSEALVHLKVDADSSFLVVDTAIPCGLILNELLSNAFTHAFPDRREGTVWVCFRQLEEDRFLLEVSDDGVGLPSGMDVRKADSMGLRLVTLLSEQLGATVEMESEGGTTVRLLFKEYFEAGTVLY